MYLIENKKVTSNYNVKKSVRNWLSLQFIQQQSSFSTCCKTFCNFLTWTQPICHTLLWRPNRHIPACHHCIRCSHCCVHKICKSFDNWRSCNRVTWGKTPCAPITYNWSFCHNLQNETRLFFKDFYCKKSYRQTLYMFVETCVILMSLYMFKDLLHKSICWQVMQWSFFNNKKNIFLIGEFNCKILAFGTIFFKFSNAK